MNDFDVVGNLSWMVCLVALDPNQSAGDICPFLVFSTDKCFFFIKFIDYVK